MLSETIFKFTPTSNIANWSIVDDAVMGGRSSGNFCLNKKGNGIFSGSISLDNRGGFSSIKYHFNKLSTTSFSKIILKVRGDGKTYQFRIKSSAYDDYSYACYFDSSKDWETIELPLAHMYPVFKGRRLNASNYDKKSIEEIAFLIGNKKVETFKLEIKAILLK